MVELIQLLIKDYGPAIGPALLISSIVMNWLYNSLVRQIMIKNNRTIMILIDKNIITLEEALKYEVLDDASRPLFSIGKV